MSTSRKMNRFDARCVCIGSLPLKGMNEMTARVYSTSGASPACRTFCGGNQETKIAIERSPFGRGGGKEPMEKEESKKTNLRIRCLTEGECYRLMGFEEKDTEACKAVGQSKANIYHQAGDSIVTTVLMGIFGELLEVPDYQAKIEAYADKLAGECK